MRTKIAILAALLFVGIASVNAQKFTEIRTVQNSVYSKTTGYIYNPHQYPVDVYVTVELNTYSTSASVLVWGFIVNDRIVTTGVSPGGPNGTYMISLYPGINSLLIDQRREASYHISTMTTINLQNPIARGQTYSNTKLTVNWNSSSPQN